MKSFLQRYCGPELAIALVLLFTLFLYAQVGEFHYDPEFQLSVDTVVIKDQELKVWLADTQESQRQGLSVFESLSPDTGMLFIFDSSDDHAFWMKNMKFNIDIFWLNEDKEVIFIKRDAKPEDYPESYQAGIDSRYVLETVSGFADLYDIQIGDHLNF